MRNEQTGGLRLVPFNSSWVQHDKLDLKAIYKRPRYVKNDVDEEVLERDANGQALYDITSALPVRQHNKWLAKGFVYVTLASRADLMAAYQKGTLVDERGGLVHFREFDQHQTGGPWNFKLYQRGQVQDDSAYVAELRLHVLQFGSDAVEQIRRSADPSFVLPASLRDIPAGTSAKALAARDATPAPGRYPGAPFPETPATETKPAARATAKPKADTKKKATETKPAAGETQLVGGFPG